MKLFSQLISVIFHPLLLTAYALLLGFLLPGYMAMLPFGYKKTVFIIFALLTALAPAVFVFLMYNLRVIGSMQMDDRKERNMPLLMTFIFYVTAYIMALRFPTELPRFVVDLLFVAALASFIVMTVNLVHKISLHSLGLAANFVFLFSYYFLFQINLMVFLMIGIVLIGLVATVRLYLNAHRPVEI